MDFSKRFSVFINGLLYFATDNLGEAHHFIEQRWGYNEITTIYDNQEREYIFTGVNI